MASGQLKKLPGLYLGVILIPFIANVRLWSRIIHSSWINLEQVLYGHSTTSAVNVKKAFITRKRHLQLSRTLRIFRYLGDLGSPFRQLIVLIGWSWLSIQTANSLLGTCKNKNLLADWFLRWESVTNFLELVDRKIPINLRKGRNAYKYTFTNRLKGRDLWHSRGMERVTTPHYLF